MTDSPSNPDTDTDGATGVGSDCGLPPSAPPQVPRWVKVSAIIVGVLILVLVIVKLTSLDGEHGPGRHIGASGTPSAGITEIQVLPVGNPGIQAASKDDYQ